MPRRLFLALLLLVAAPMVLLGWMSVSAVRSSEAAAKQSVTNLLSTQLYEADDRMTLLFEGYAVMLDRELEDGLPITQALRRLRREVPVVRQGVLVDRTGILLFPPADDSVGVDSSEVAAMLPGMIDARPLPSRQFDNAFQNNAFKNNAPLDHVSVGNVAPGDRNQAEPQQQEMQQVTQQEMQQQAVFDPPQNRVPDLDPMLQMDQQRRLQSNHHPVQQFVDSAWQQWYMADGAQVVYWKLRDDGSTVGLLLERSRWMADLIAELPDDTSALALKTKDLSTAKNASVALVDEANRTIYRWGDSQQFKLAPLVTSDLSTPLASWKLRLHVDPSVIPSSSPIPMYLSLGGIALVLLAIGFYVLTSVQRQIAQAKSRVSFAGQVSHELRTPLTNIRLYTELAESDLKRVQACDATRSLTKRLEVIDHESRRLQRLVSGVLEMIRPTGKRIGIRKVPTDLCDLVAGIADQFTPSFRAAEIELETHCDLTDPVSIDPDIVEMVLVNLLSNVEKYVPKGGRCWIECTLAGPHDSQPGPLQIIVADNGPGIGAMHRTKVFRAFERLDDSVSAPSGTGIGLTIARRAAQRHHGDLTLLSKSRYGGATFQLTLPILEQ